MRCALIRLLAPLVALAILFGAVPTARADRLNNPNEVEHTLACNGQSLTVVGTLHSAGDQIVGSTGVAILEMATVTSPSGSTETIFQRGQGQMEGVSLTPCTETVSGLGGSYLYTYYVHLTPERSRG